MIRIPGAEEGALVVVEPLGEPGIAGVLEVHYGVFIAIEQFRIEHLGCLMGHSGVAKLRIRVHRTRDKAAEVGSGGRPVEAMIVIQHSYEHEQIGGKTYQLARTRGEMQLNSYFRPEEPGARPERTAPWSNPD